MSHITKTVTLSGSSPHSMEEAITGVLARAAETIEEVQSFTVESLGGTVDGSGLPEFMVTLAITFVVRESTPH